MGDLWSRLGERQKKLISWLAIALVIGIGLLVLRPPTATPPASLQVAPVDSVSSQSLATTWERKLTAILNRMLGGNYTQVFLTLERGPSLNISHNVTEEERQTAEGGTEWRRTLTPVILRNDAERKETALVLEEIEPAVRGVLIVVDHKLDVELNLKLAQAVATVLQVPMYRIEVLSKQ